MATFVLYRNKLKPFQAQEMAPEDETSNGEVEWEFGAHDHFLSTIMECFVKLIDTISRFYTF